MKFLCVSCEVQMVSVGQRAPGDGTLGILFRCPDCDREIAMLTNPMETQMVSSLCVKLDDDEGEERPEPFEGLSAGLSEEAASASTEPGDARSAPSWSPEAEARLQRVPGFVRGVVRRMYSDWARDRQIVEITPDVMDRARGDLDLEGMAG